MARTDWAAVLTEPAAEYLAHSELCRFGLTAYMPQIRKHHRTPQGRYVMRQFPLFARYLLVRYGDAQSPSVRMARGICRIHPVLADDDGRPWRAPAKVVEAIQQAEQRGDFDEILHKGDQVTLTYGVLATVRSVMNSDAATGMVEILTPLFGGSRARIDRSRLSHAHG